MRERPVLQNILIEGYANEGKCISHHDGKVLFVKGAVPGETVNVQITKSKKDFSEGEVMEVLQPSPDRQIPFCIHYGYCGGCQWQHMKYEAQLRYKQEAVIETLARLGKIFPKEILPIEGSDSDRHYRNKLEFTFTHREWQLGDAWKENSSKEKIPALGFHLPGAFDRIFDVKECHLQDSLGDRIRLAIRKFTIENDYEYFHLRRQTGLMRGLMIRIATTGQVMVLIAFAEKQEEKIAALMEFLKKEFPEITSLQYVINTKKNDTIYDLEVITYHGTDAIEENIGELKFRVSAKSFFQTNTKQAEKLYQCVRDFTDLTGNELVYDLYTGTGSIALYLANHCKEVVGIESVAQAIEDARMNASINNITNVSFHTADIADLLKQSFYNAHGKSDVVITDPPRAGMHETVVKELLEMEALRIVYVSCNVATQARDMQLLSEKYSVEKIRPFDLFPHTKHIENVALLIRK